MTADLRITADAAFDGESFSTGPVTVVVAAGRIRAVLPGYQEVPARAHRHTAFLMPGLVEAHCHLFLDGDEQDQARRAAHLDAGLDTWLATGRRNLTAARAAGITLIRDAGDRHGVNHAVRAEAACAGTLPTVRSPGLAIRKRGRYGSFMAGEVDDAAGCAAAIEQRVAAGADDLKILLTGIIDFANATVKGAPQFTLDELRVLVDEARRAGRPSFAHCSGADGLALAVDAGVDSVEHGFFMSEAILVRMAERRMTWVPTWSPVGFMRDHPQVAGLDQAARDGLARILDQHRTMIGRAHALGVALVAGSDAGSWGVPHGAAIHDELAAYADAGVPLAALLATATSVPRRAWGVEGGRVLPGQPADLALFAADPRSGLAGIRRASAVVLGGALAPASEPVLSLCV